MPILGVGDLAGAQRSDPPSATASTEAQKPWDRDGFAVPELTGSECRDARQNGGAALSRGEGKSRPEPRACVVPSDIHSAKLKSVFSGYCPVD